MAPTLMNRKIRVICRARLPKKRMMSASPAPKRPLQRTSGAGDDGHDTVFGTLYDAAGKDTGDVASETHHRHQRMLALGSDSPHQPVEIEGNAREEADVLQQVETQ
jgi:hypothetical protein